MEGPWDQENSLRWERLYRELVTDGNDAHWSREREGRLAWVMSGAPE